MLAVDGAGASAAVLALAAAVGGAEGVHASTARCVAADKYDADMIGGSVFRFVCRRARDGAARPRRRNLFHSYMYCFISDE